jgi:hypothetical protein
MRTVLQSILSVAAVSILAGCAPKVQQPSPAPSPAPSLAPPPAPPPAPKPAVDSPTSSSGVEGIFGKIGVGSRSGIFGHKNSTGTTGDVAKADVYKVPVYYGTNRRRSTLRLVIPGYTTTVGRLEVGTVYVSIPTSAPGGGKAS